MTIGPLANRIIALHKRCWIATAVVALLVDPATARAQAAAPVVRVAEILEASGKVEIRRSATGAWTVVRTGHELVASDAIRTHPVAFARIKFEAGPQWLLRATSVLQLGAAVGGTANTIQVRLESGKAVGTWTPDRQTAANTAAVPARAIIETPSGQASIDGTEWSISVDDDGRTSLWVIEGTVEMSNALGRITVGAEQGGEMRVGQAPTRLQIINPSDRVQWVADYAAQPLRFADASIGTARVDLETASADAAAGLTAEAIDRLERAAKSGVPPAGVLLALADLLIEAGELPRARTHVEAGTKHYPNDARFDALLSRIALFEDHAEMSRSLAEQATAKDPKSVDGWLALGEWARSAGDGPLARQAFRQATLIAPGDGRGWFGRGSVETDYEAFGPARRWLNQAVAIDPHGPGYRGEIGTLETLANNFDSAEREYALALGDRQADYVAMTGRALLALKQGREPEALDWLLKATLIEPKYARAQVYLGVAYYRLRRHDDAIRALDKASALDPRDPLPHLMKSAIYTDLYEPSKAMAAGRRARDLMPNLKSLNQLANTQKGTANLGNSVAFMGMPQWSQHLAQESYYPFWAGSHLFLGDQYLNAFARTSEYYQGLLADPTVFGGSPLFQTLLPRAGHYLTADVGLERDGQRVQSGEAVVSANGYLNQRLPIGYSVSARGAGGRGTDPVANAERRPLSASAAIGAAPSPRLSFFANGSFADEREQFTLPFLAAFGPSDLQWSKQGRHFDAGVNFRPSPLASLAARIGEGRTSANLPLGGLIPRLAFSSNPAEVQARYTRLVADRHQLSTGFELASDRQNVAYAIAFVGANGLDRDMQSAQLYVSAQSRWGPAMFQADLSGTRELVEFSVPDGSAPPSSYSNHELQPRVGATLRVGPAVLRAAYQQRTRPWAAVSTLGPVATAGIPIDDELVELGGSQRRGRGQMEWEWSARTFISAFAEYQTVENRVELNGLEDLVGTLQLRLAGHADSAGQDLASALSDLRNIARDASRSNVTALSLIEGDPNVANGHASAIGAALNRVLSTRLSLATHYTFRSSSGVSAVLDGPDPRSSGQMLSYVPRHTSSIGVTWIHPRRLYLSAEGIHRSSRFASYVFHPETAEPTRPLRPADWTARVAGSWESADKRWSIELAASELLSRHSSGVYAVTAKVRR